MFSEVDLYCHIVLHRCREKWIELIFKLAKVILNCSIYKCIALSKVRVMVFHGLFSLLTDLCITEMLFFV